MNLLRRAFDAGFAFLLPLPLFLQVQGGLGLYAGGFASEGLSVPLAFLFAPLACAIGAVDALRSPSVGQPGKWIIGLLSLWIAGLGLASVATSPSALLYAGQWLAPFPLVLYGASLVADPARLQAFLRAFVLGTAFALLDVLGQAVVEALMRGGLPGRMSQNYVLPGMYQLYNYVPVGTTFCGLAAATWLLLGGGLRRRLAAYAILLGTLGVVVATGARGPIASMVLAVPLLLLMVSGVRKLLMVCVPAALVVAALFLFAPGEVLLLDKLADVVSGDEFGGITGNREVMAGEYLRVIERRPVVGTAMLPPAIATPELGVEIKSAHNYYLDSLAWAGPVGLLLVLAFVFAVLLQAAAAVVSCRPGEPLLDRPRTRAALAAVPGIVGLLIVSCNLRVPLREPYPAAPFAVCAGILLAVAELKRGVAEPSRAARRAAGPTAIR